MNKSLETATFGGGCFWCTEAIFQQLRGVEKVESGYSGGEAENPNYTQVSSGQTGHAEVIQIHFDPSQISYDDLLEVFFATHDPTTPNRQGADVGSQYRSIILYHSEEQKRSAQQTVAKIKGVVTEIKPFESFHTAEDYHQDYFNKNPGDAYCSVVISPKLKKLREKFGAKLKD